MKPEAKPRFKGNLIKEMMATCGTVEEALALIDRYSLVFHDPIPVVHSPMPPAMPPLSKPMRSSVNKATISW